MKRHRENPTEKISIYGQEKTAETIKLCRLNLAVHGLSGDIKQANSYYEDVQGSVAKFDFVMANPPFNVDFFAPGGCQAPAVSFDLDFLDNRNGSSQTPCHGRPWP